MKKLLLLPLILLSFLLLTGCNNNVDYTYVDASQGKEMTSWLKSDIFSDKQIILDESKVPGKEATRFEIFLPKDIVESTRYITTNIESIYETHFNDINVNYYSFSVINQYLDYILNIANGKNKDIIAAYNAAGLELSENYYLNYNYNFSNKNLSDFAAKEGYERSIVAAYLPLKVEYYLAKDKSDAVKVLTTYIIVPVKVSLEYTQGGKLASDSVYSKFESIELKIENGLLA